MILYLLFFFVCFLIEYQKEHKMKSIVLFVIMLYIFLCFGYMTGSDWRGYEPGYNSQTYWRMEDTGEIGYVIITKFFAFFIHDFWVYNGLMKCLYLASLLKFLKCFSPHPYIAVALGFSNSLLFMLIDCPLRFMMALTLVLFSFVLLISKRNKRNIIISVVLLLLSVTIHTSMVVMVIFVLLAYYAPMFSKLGSFSIILLFVASLMIAMFSGVFDFIFYDIMPIFSGDRFENYTLKEQSTLMTINTIRYVVLLLVVLSNKKSILLSQYGTYVFFYACLYFLFFPITYSIPTMFRLNIFFGLFADISFAHILCNWSKNSIQRKCESVIILFVVLFMLCRNCIEDEKLTPYSNSIPYIIKGQHLPFPYRDSYNYIHHESDYMF